MKFKALFSAYLSALLLANTASAAETEIIKHQVYGQRDGMAMFYDVEIPENPNGLGIVLVVSGGWLSGEDNLNVTKPFWEVLLEAGYTLFEIYHPGMPKYRIPDAFDALKVGIQHIKDNGEDFGIDVDRLGIIGISSGGHLALLMGMSVDPAERTEADFDAIVAIMPVVDIRSLSPDDSLFGTRHLDFDPELIPLVSPVDYVSPDDPPTLLIHGKRDGAVNFEINSVRMQSLLDENDIENELLAIDADHEVFPEPDLSRTHSAILNWFEKHL